MSSSLLCSCSPVSDSPFSGKSATKRSNRFNFDVLTPVLVRHSDWEKLSVPSKQVYSTDISPMSAEHTTPKHSEMVFIELRTRHAPVPHDSSISPMRPITDAFSLRDACMMGSCFC